ncbi:MULTISPECIES: SHOCT domain-containing protein [Streptomyces]|uniref:SHOCT domain-containing protein n=1 Tax=Streptomyces TaxID=1883 RepID=UPI000CF21843|nr:SHOCT domain-containing protein [Streptomyces sp. 46]
MPPKKPQPSRAPPPRHGRPSACRLDQVADAGPGTPGCSAGILLSDKIEQLRRLGELRDQGVLTEAEFEEHKRRLLQA